MYKLNEIETVGVIGSGVMGHGIAIVCASAGYKVVLFDVSPDTLSRGQEAVEKFTQKSVDKNKMSAEDRQRLLDRITFTTDLTLVKAELIVEAIPENLELKQDLFRNLETGNSERTILTTNTSSIPVTQIAAALERPERFAGLHFFNPAPIMKLVEIIAGEATASQVTATLTDLTRKLGKVPALVQDSPGFIVNRVARFYYLESLRVLEHQVADPETIDKIMENAGFRMGPFKLMDLIGIETNHEVTKSIYHSFYEEARFRPSRIQQKKVEARTWGRKTGKGFYTYDK